MCFFTITIKSNNEKFIFIFFCYLHVSVPTGHDKDLLAYIAIHFELQTFLYYNLLSSWEACIGYHTRKSCRLAEEGLHSKRNGSKFWMFSILNLHQATNFWIATDKKIFK